MNRLEEYQELMQELEVIPATSEQRLTGAVKRARSRRTSSRILRTAANAAAVFAVFVLLVNFSTPVAYACSKVPILKELAEAVTFSRSLTDAVDHEYVQPMDIYQEQGDISASVEYLIVDQKQVNVFFRLDSEVYSGLSADPQVLLEDGKRPASCSYGMNDFDAENGQLQSLTIDFIDGNVPDALIVGLNVYHNGNMAGGVEEIAPPANAEDEMFEEREWEDPEYIEKFQFLLKFDPAFTAAGKKIVVNQTIFIDDQEITFTDMEIYPSYLSVNVEESEGNSAWLQSLEFYVETDWGMKFDTITNGIKATGSAESPAMTSFRADSSYFYEADHLKIMITGAEWLDKDMEKVSVNLETGEASALPEGVEFYSAVQKSGGWLVEFKASHRKPNHFHQLFASEYYGLDGKRYEIMSWSSTYGEEYDENGDSLYFIESFPLKGYSESEVWLCPHYSRVWTAEEPIAVVVK